MSTMIRKQIYIEPDQNALLKRLSGESGVPEAELIRQAIDNHIRALRHPRRAIKAWEAEREFIAKLMEQATVSGGRTWNRETLHER
jgi:hypothetical protein